MNYEQVLEAGMVRHAEKRFPVGRPTTVYKAVTGEPYVTLTDAGIRAEGELLLGGQPAQAQASDAWKASFDSLYPVGGVLYWRHKPTLEQDPSDKSWHVYSRLLVSSKSTLLE